MYSQQFISFISNLHFFGTILFTYFSFKPPLPLFSVSLTLLPIDSASTGRNLEIPVWLMAWLLGNVLGLGIPIKDRGEALLLTLSLQLHEDLLLSLKAQQTTAADFLVLLTYYTSKLIMAFLPRALPLLLLAVVCIQLSGGKILMTL